VNAPKDSEIDADQLEKHLVLKRGMRIPGGNAGTLRNMYECTGMYERTGTLRNAQECINAQERLGTHRNVLTHRNDY
jgi:hypothetical protein